MTTNNRKRASLCTVLRTGGIGFDSCTYRPTFADAVMINDPFQSRPMLHVRLDYAIRYAMGEM